MLCSICLDSVQSSDAAFLSCTFEGCAATFHSACVHALLAAASEGCPACPCCRRLVLGEELTPLELIVKQTQRIKHLEDQSTRNLSVQESTEIKSAVEFVFAQHKQLEQVAHQKMSMLDHALRQLLRHGTGAALNL